MDESFDAFGYVEQVGHDLVRDFERARTATTPGLVGSAMERSVRDALETLLPYSAAIGSGCVIDSQHQTSRQMDVVIYERGHLPNILCQQQPGNHVLSLRRCNRRRRNQKHVRQSRV